MQRLVRFRKLSLNRKLKNNTIKNGKKALVFECIEYPIRNLSEDELRRRLIQEKLQLQRLKEEEEKRLKLQQIQGRGYVDRIKLGR